MPIKLSDIFVDRVNTIPFKTTALQFFRDITVTGTTLDADILKATKEAVAPKITTNAALEIFLKDLDKDQALVDKIILGATKTILKNPIEDQRIYDRLLIALSQSNMIQAHFDLFNTTVKVGGAGGSTGGSGSSGSGTGSGTGTGTGGTSGGSGAGSGNSGGSGGGGAIPFPETQQILDTFIAAQLVKFKADELVITDFNTTAEKAYLTLLGATDYAKAQDETYKLLYKEAAYNTLILLAFIPILEEKYFNENLMVSLHDNVPQAKFDEILKDIIRDKINGSGGKVEKPIKKNILQIYQDKLDQKDPTQGKKFKEIVKKSQEEGPPLTFVVLCESLSQELPVFIGLHIDPTAALNAIAITIKKIIDTFGQDFFTKFFDINKLLTDITAGLTLELGPSWAVPWISSIASTISAVSSGNATVAFMTFDQPPPNGTGQQLPSGNQFKNYFNQGLLQANYGGDKTGNVIMLVESIIDYLDDVYKLMKYTTPYPYLPSPFFV